MEVWDLIDIGIEMIEEEGMDVDEVVEELRVRYNVDWQKMNLVEEALEEWVRENVVLKKERDED